ncbi:MAG: hypothetical protein U0X87_13295 [Anaerolineales bacterium]
MDTKQYIQIFDALDDNDQSNSATKNGRKQKYPLRNPKKDQDRIMRSGYSKMTRRARTSSLTKKPRDLKSGGFLIPSVRFTNTNLSAMSCVSKGGKEASVYLYDIQG